MSGKIVVLVTCGSAKEANRIATALVNARVAACVNVLSSPVRSVYRWKGKVETTKEHLLLLKTSRQRFAQIEREIRSLHSYQLPEIIALPIVKGSKAYLNWLGDSVAASPTAKKKK